jgi:hypothetical protein
MFDTLAAGCKRYWWQKNDVFNHVAPLLESRLAKLDSDGTELAVVPFSDNEESRVKAENTEKILKSVFRRVDMKNASDQANLWSEMTGTAFYKVTWDADAGLNVNTKVGGELVPIKFGEVRVDLCSPFEIYPENLACGDINMTSIIHARLFNVEQVKRIWGVDVAGREEEIRDYNRSNAKENAVMPNACTVIERYKDGALTIVAGEKLVFHGVYERLPFVRQTSESLPSAFFGKSVIERAIPVQRAYNAVKNRKAELLNRLTCGVLTVEDGSVDIESLENDGLAPGTIISYSSGTNAPAFMNAENFPKEFELEEERLLGELAMLTGGSDITRGEFSNISGVALEIMVGQNQMRIRRALASAKHARILVAIKILELYREYAVSARLGKLASGRKVETFTWSGEDIESLDIIEVIKE